MGAIRQCSTGMRAHLAAGLGAGARRRAVAGCRRGLGTTSARPGLKESFCQTDVDYEKHKRDSLARQKAGAGEWKPELASDSEEAVRADREPAPPGGIAKLQEQAKRSAEERSRRGTGGRDGA
ncbi:uncharacterized protein MAM_04177 [Metarhizium album ARSEF 1941]|uniref:Mitochondrial carrier protein PET8 n=1 Tax=Metarhizium album (strain ARSEF 1941) TaxID=1081103 RepID=A0A0B2WUP7_METAS|nr:uncharacterized protein MAM_04177 [Metarhizium album ARSEF 1941]KHN97788.1 hypothetical protein MAM_04177 [Metarhizium album ARSEF 1941]